MDFLMGLNIFHGFGFGMVKPDESISLIKKLPTSDHWLLFLWNHIEPRHIFLFQPSILDTNYILTIRSNPRQDTIFHQIPTINISGPLDLPSISTNADANSNRNGININ